MFDMKEIGCKIAKLRKGKNMTQMELADALGISFQAISNWERGESMPDIAKLVSLSQIFDVSIDEILGNDRIAKTVSELASGTDKEPLDTEVIKEIAPIVKPDQLSKLVSDSMKLMMEKVSHMDYKPGTTQTITEITPNGSVVTIRALPGEEMPVTDFTSQEAEVSHEKKGVSPSLKQLLELAPFMAEEDLSELVCNYADQVDDFNDIISLAPFLDEEIVDHLIHRYSKSDLDFHKILSLAPFCSEDTLSSLALQYMKQIDSFDKVVRLAPFLDENILSDIVETNLELALTMEQFKQLLPFLNEDTVGKIARKLLLK